MRRRTQQKAFTLLELLVVIGLMSSLLLMMMSSGNNTQVRRENTRNSITEIFQMFNKARNNAVTSTTVVSDGGTFTPQNGFGVNIHIDHTNIGESVFTLFADTDDGVAYAPVPTPPTGTPVGIGDYKYTDTPTSNDIKFQEFKFPVQNGEINSFKGVTAGTTPLEVDFLSTNTITDVSILFAPPSGEVVIQDSAGALYKKFTIDFLNPGLFGESLSVEKEQRFVERTKTFPAPL